MKQIFIKTRLYYLCLLCIYIFIGPVTSCFAHSLLSNQLISKMPLEFNQEQPLSHITIQSLSAENNNIQELPYLQAMRNAYADQGEVLWGGEIELTTMAQLYNVQIILGVRQEDGSIKYININEGATNSSITLYYTGDHYMYYDVNGDLVNVNGDGNCMFVAFLKANNMDESLSSVTKLRNQVVNKMSQDPDIAQKISINLAGDNRINGAVNLIDLSKASNSNPMTAAEKQKRGKRYSEEDRARLFQKEQDNPSALTKQERRCLYNMRYRQDHAEEIKKYYQDNAEERKKQQQQYKKDHAEEIKEYMRKYKKDNAKETKRYWQQYNKDHAEDIKQYYQDHAEEIKQQQQQYSEYNKVHAEEIMQCYKNNAEKIRQQQNRKDNDIGKNEQDIDLFVFLKKFLEESFKVCK